MEEIEHKTIASACFQSKLWQGYVDDVFAIWSHDNKKIENIEQNT